MNTIIIDKNPDIREEKGQIYIKLCLFAEFSDLSDSRARHKLDELRVEHFEEQNEIFKDKHINFYSINSIEQKTTFKFEIVLGKPRLLVVKNLARGDFFESDDGDIYTIADHLGKLVDAPARLIRRKMVKNTIKFRVEEHLCGKEMKFFSAKDIIEKVSLYGKKLEICGDEKKYLKVSDFEIDPNFFVEGGITYGNIHYLKDKLRLNPRYIRRRINQVSHKNQENPVTKRLMNYYNTDDLRKKIHNYDRRLKVLDSISNYLEIVETAHNSKSGLKLLPWLIIHVLVLYKNKWDFWPTDCEISKYLKKHHYKNSSISTEVCFLITQGYIVREKFPYLLEYNGEIIQVRLPLYKITQKGFEKLRFEKTIKDALYKIWKNQIASTPKK